MPTTCRTVPIFMAQPHKTILAQFNTITDLEHFYYDTNLCEYIGLKQDAQGVLYY